MGGDGAGRLTEDAPDRESAQPRLAWLTPHWRGVGTMFASETPVNRVAFGQGHRFARLAMSLSNKAPASGQTWSPGSETGELFVEVATGRELWLPGNAWPSMDEHRALLVRHTNHSPEPGPGELDLVFARFANLDTGALSDELELADREVAVDPEVDVAVLSLARSGAPLTWIDANERVDMGRDGMVVLDLDALALCKNVLGSCHRVVVASDGSRALYVTRDASGDVAHIFSPADRELQFASSGTTITALTWSLDLRYLGLAFSSGTVDTYLDDERIASLSQRVKGSLGMSADGRRIAWTDGHVLKVDDGTSEPEVIHRVAAPAHEKGAPLDWCAMRAFGTEVLELSGDMLVARSGGPTTGCPVRTERYTLTTLQGSVESADAGATARAEWEGRCEPASLEHDAVWSACVSRDGRMHVWSATTGVALFTGAPEATRRRLVGTTVYPDVAKAP